MHIVFVSREYVPSLRAGGIASYVKDIAHGLVQKGHDVTVICASDNTNERNEYYEESGVKVICLDGGDFIIPSIEGKSFLKKFRCIYRFYSYRKKIKDVILSLEHVDVIEVPEFGAEGYYLMDLKIPVVIRLHTPSFLDRSTFKKKKYPFYRLHDWWCAYQEQVVIKKAKYITSCSESLKEWVIEYFNVANNIKVIYNPIDIDKWVYCDAKSEPDAKTILFVGTVAKEKGVSELIQACDKLHDKYNLNLCIAGKLGKYGTLLKKDSLKKEWCFFLGNVKRDDLLKLYNRSYIVCFPSWWDNLPIVCLEAMSCGCVVVASCNGGMSEIIDDGVSGFLVQPKDSLILSDKLHQVLNLNENEILKIRHEARKKIKSNFSLDIILNQMIEYYSSLK